MTAIFTTDCSALQSTLCAAFKQRAMEDIAADFLRDGFVRLPQLLQAMEIAALQRDTAHIIDGGYENKEHPIDYMTAPDDNGERIFHRVQYVFPKAPEDSLVTLLGHPFILALVQHLLGPDAICAAEALVWKAKGNGREVPVHADCDPADAKLSPLIFNIDYYLDDATPENGCLWAAPGTHTLNLPINDIVRQGFDFPGLQSVPMQAGDVLLHNIRVVHGSHRSRGGALRRTLYYEWQSVRDMEKQNGPRPGHPLRNNFVEDRVRLLMRAIDQRQSTLYGVAEPRFPYQAPTGYDVPWLAPDEPINRRPALGYNAYI